MQTNQIARDRQAQVTKIRELNDAFRQTLTGGKVVITPSVAGLPLPQRADLLELVRTFADFEFSGDPYGEHDFGSVQIATEQFFWKIDYFDTLTQARQYAF